MTTKMWTVQEFHNCQGDDAQELDGVPVIALCANKQVADQIADKVGAWAHVSEMIVQTNAKGF